jgi:hypothetical protein
MATPELTATAAATTTVWKDEAIGMSLRVLSCSNFF